MTTHAQIGANRTNGKLSSGPKTTDGKAASRMNAVTHGLRSLAPVLPDECPEEWDQYRAGILASLTPVGALEAELVERVALLTWRMRRVVRYETAVTSAGIDAAVGRVRGEEEEEDKEKSRLKALLFPQKYRPPTQASVRKELDEAQSMARGSAAIRDRLRRLPELPDEQPIAGCDAFTLLWSVGAYTRTGPEGTTEIEDHEFLAAIGVPAEWRDDADWWTGWTVGIVRAGVRIVARNNGLTENALIEWAAREADREARSEERKVMKLEQLLDHLSERIAGAEQLARGQNSLPVPDAADRVMRYEAHLNKQLTQTLHQLERLQALRSGNPPAPPAALDVTVETGN